MKSIPSKTPSIYQIRHIESGKVYVGSAVNPRKRCNEHRNSLRNGTHHSRHLQRAWDKYGADAFEFEIIEPVLFTEDLIAREQHWIDILRAADRDYGYNTSSVAGSTLGVIPTEETREKLRAAMDVRPNPMSDPAIREKHRIATLVKDDAWRAKQKAGVGAYKRSDEGRKQTSEMMKRRYEDPAYRANLAAKSKQTHKNPAYRTAHAERMKGLPQDPAWRASTERARQDPVNVAAQKAGMERLSSDPEWQAWRAQKNRELTQDPTWRAAIVKANAKTYAGFVAPDGTVYSPIYNLNAFCKEHGLSQPSMARLASGKGIAHRGWTRYISDE